MRGWSPVGLDPAGIKEAESSAKLMSNVPATLVISSDLPRTLQTAQILQAWGGGRIVPTPGARTWNVGLLTGQPKAIGNHLREFFFHHPDQAIPEGESYGEFLARWRHTLDQIILWAEQHGPVKIVTHNSNLCLLPHLLQGKPNIWHKKLTEHPGGALLARREVGEWTLTHLN